MISCLWTLDLLSSQKLKKRIFRIHLMLPKTKIMKIFTLLIAFLISINLNAQWTSDLDANTLVVESESGDMQAIGTSDGKTFIVFWKSVAAPTNYELRLQLLDAAGNRQFGPDGMLISNTIPMSTFTVVWTVTVDKDDNLYVGVTGTGDESGHAFKMDTEGNQLWGADGISIGSGYTVTILPMATNDAIITWMSGTKTLMQKYDVNGNTLWNAPLEVISSEGNTAPGNLHELSDGGYVLIFHTYNYGIYSTLYAQRYNSEGIAQWDSPTQLSNKTTAWNKMYSSTQDEDVVYLGYMAAANNRFDSYLQRINPDGTLPWGINGMDFNVDQAFYEMETSIAYSLGSQYVWSICTYKNETQSEHGEYVQKFDKVTGERLLTDNGKMVFAVSDDHREHASTLQLINDQPFFLMKDGYDNSATPITLHTVKLDSNGDFAWPEETKPVATYAANKGRIHLTNTVNAQAVAVFIEDKSTGSKIYAQNFIDEPEQLEQPTLISPLNEATDIPLSTTFTWNATPNAETYKIQIAGDDAFTNPIADESGIVPTSFDTTLPEHEATYYWRILASNSTGDSDWSEVWSFTTKKPTGIGELSPMFDVKVFPNPTKNYLNIDTEQDLRAEIYTLHGKMIKSVSAKELNNPINISDLADGVYILNLMNTDGKIIGIKKIIKM